MISTEPGILDLVKKIQNLEEQNMDYVPKTSQLDMSADGTKLRLRSDSETVGIFNMSSHFEGQLADKLEIPRMYYNSMESIPNLKATTVNMILNHKNEKKMVRTQKGIARAFLSNRYKRIDHSLVVEPFMQALTDYKKAGGSYSIKTTSLTDSRMYVQAIIPDIKGEIISEGRGKEVLYAGISFTNSEIGLGSFDISLFLYWLACSNGAIGQSLIRKYHTGRRIGEDDEDYTVYSDKTIELEMETFKSKLGDIFKTTLSGDAFSDILKKIQITTNDPIDNPRTLIKNVTKKYQLSEEHGDFILKEMMREKNMNRYGLLNGITRLAQEVENADYSYDLEKTGFNIIELKPTEWRLLADVDNLK